MIRGQRRQGQAERKGVLPGAAEISNAVAATGRGGNGVIAVLQIDHRLAVQEVQVFEVPNLIVVVADDGKAALTVGRRRLFAADETDGLDPRIVRREVILEPVEGAGLAEVAVPALILSAMGLILFSVGLRIYKWY